MEHEKFCGVRRGRGGEGGGRGSREEGGELGEGGGGRSMGPSFPANGPSGKSN